MLDAHSAAPRHRSFWRAPLMALISLLMASSASAVVMDQQNLLSGAEGNWQLQYAGPVGQSFIPSYDTLASIDVMLKEANPQSASLPIVLNVREGSLTGNIIATGSATPFDGVFSQDYVNFDLGGAISVAPSNLYVFELIAQNARGMVVHTSDHYGSCSAYFQGSLNASSDLVFTAWAATVPEPGTALLLGLGLAIIGRRSAGRR